MQGSKGGTAENNAQTLKEVTSQIQKPFTHSQTKQKEERIPDIVTKVLLEHSDQITRALPRSLTSQQRNKLHLWRGILEILVAQCQHTAS